MPADPRAALLEAIQKRTYIATVPCHCVDANLNHWPDCTCDHGKRYEERSYDFYALLDAALEEARKEQRKADALIAEREYYRQENGPCIAAAILRGGEEKNAGR